MRSFMYLGALICAGALFAAQRAEAAYTFATVGHAVTGPDFTFTNNGTSGTAANNHANTIVSFNFSNDFPFPLPAGVAPPQSANAFFTMSATTTTAATISSGIANQSGLAGTMEFRRISVGSLLLGVSFVNARITGDVGSSSGSLNGATFLASNVIFTSDYFVVSPQVNNSFAIGLTNVTPAFGGTSGTGPFMNTFTADIGGPFSTDTRDNILPSPAPQSLMLLLTAVPALGIGGYFYRRRV